MLGLLAVVVAATALSLTSSGGRLPPPPWAAEPAAKKPAAPPAGPDAAAARPARAAVVSAATAEELAAALADPKAAHVRLTGRLYDLTRLPEGVVYRGEAGRRLHLDGGGGAGHPPAEVRVAAAPLDAAAPSGPARSRSSAATP